MNHPNHNQPSPILEAIARALLPPSRREQVLGDLAERYSNRSPSGVALYLLDAFDTIGHVWWSVARRRFFGPPPRLAGASARAIQERTEQLQGQLKYRYWIFMAGLFAHRTTRDLISLAGHEWVNYAVTALALAWILIALPTADSPYRRRRDGNLLKLANPSPNPTSRVLHRQALEHLQKLEQGWWRPLGPLLLLFLWVNDLPADRFYATFNLTARIVLRLGLAAAGYALCLALARLRTRRLQKEIDGLGTDDADNDGNTVLNRGVQA